MHATGSHKKISCKLFSEQSALKMRTGGLVWPAMAILEKYITAL
jgi:hypothetical protein